MVLDSLSRHKNVTTEFLRQINGIPKGILENLGTDLAKKAVAMSREVDGDLHRHKAFLRPSVSPHGILYAKLYKMNHHNEKLLLKFFLERFPDFIVIFESKRGVFIKDQNSYDLITDRSLDEVLEELEKKRPINPLFKELNGKNYQELWESFAQSQIIQGRRISK
ncbi:MAG: DUF4130 domain-containing protein, partial [Candidatus Heimdallarchaeota archaeon]